MDIKLKFLGAARSVTGSQYCVEANGTRLLVDCGLYQEREFLGRNWEPFLIPPDSIDAVLLTHVHIDHCGLLPKLVREGFRGKICCTAATSDMSEIMLLDSAKLHEEDAEFKRRRHEREGRKGPHPEVPLYTIDDAESVLPLRQPVRYRQPVELGEGIQATFYDAGHVLGSAMIMLTVRQGDGTRKLLFSGDVGGRNRPIVKDPTIFDEADHVIVESTYGDRLHDKSEDTGKVLADMVNSTLEAGGNLVVPIFALERAQEVLYCMNELLSEGRIPEIEVFLDSPMAVSITEVFKHHPDLYDEEMTKLVNLNLSPFQMPGLKMVRSVEDSRAINLVSKSVIMAGSGMCTGGRIKHHLVTNITRPESTILFLGFQARGTLGREIVNGAKRVRILGQHYPVLARIAQLHGFSAHADRDGLLGWLSGLKKPPKHLFVTHGESDVAESFSQFVGEKTGWNTSAPEYRTEVALD